MKGQHRGPVDVWGYFPVMLMDYVSYVAGNGEGEATLTD